MMTTTEERAMVSARCDMLIGDLERATAKTGRLVDLLNKLDRSAERRVVRFLLDDSIEQIKILKRMIGRHEAETRKLGIPTGGETRTPGLPERR